MQHLALYLGEDHQELPVALDAIAELEQRSMSDFGKLFLWAAIEHYDSLHPFLKLRGITPPAVNPYRRLFQQQRQRTAA